MILGLLLILELISSIFTYSCYGYLYERTILDLFGYNLVIYTIFVLTQLVAVYTVNNYSSLNSNYFYRKALYIYKAYLIIVVIINISMVI